MKMCGLLLHLDVDGLQFRRLNLLLNGRNLRSHVGTSFDKKLPKGERSSGGRLLLRSQADWAVWSATRLSWALRPRYQS